MTRKTLTPSRVELEKESGEVTRIGQEAVRVAQEESRAMGVPNVYSINGVLHWELPDGSLTTEDPHRPRD